MVLLATSLFGATVRRDAGRLLLDRIAKLRFNTASQPRIRLAVGEGSKDFPMDEAASKIEYSGDCGHCGSDG